MISPVAHPRGRAPVPGSSGISGGHLGIVDVGRDPLPVTQDKSVQSVALVAGSPALDGMPAGLSMHPASLKFRRHRTEVCGLCLHFLPRSASAKFQERGSSQGVPEPNLPQEAPANFPLAFFPCLLFQTAQNEASPEGLRMTMITEPGSSKQFISPTLATKLINVIQHILRQNYALRYE